MKTWGVLIAVTFSLQAFAVPAKEKISPLAQMKKFELGHQWEDCAKLGVKNFEANIQIRPWILISWLKCSRKASESTQKSDQLILALTAMKRNELYLSNGPWRSQLLTEMVRSYLEALERLSKKKYAEALEIVNQLATYSDRLDKDQKAKFYAYAGDAYLGLHQPVNAKHFYQLSLGEKESKAVRERLGGVYVTLNEVPVRPELPTPIEILSEDERKYEERLQVALKQNDWVNYVEDGVIYLNQFPTGMKAKAIQEKIFDIYSDLNDQSQKVDSPSHKQVLAVYLKVVAAMDRINPSRAIEWAQRAHKKTDYHLSLRLGEIAHKDYFKTTQGSLLLYILGRSAQFVGQYSKAQTYFRQYLQYHAGGEDVGEILFRLGLAYLRQKDYSSAISTFERLIVSKNAEKYELSSRYWIIRSLQAQQNLRAIDEIAYVLEKYPLSYYGIRLSAERRSNVFEWPSDQVKPKDSPQKLPLLEAHQLILKRAELLAKNEWYLEAQSEVVDLPQAKEANLKVNQARMWTKFHAFPSVIKLVNEAVDLNPELRSLDLISVTFPKVYLDKIQKEAEAKGLSPYLVRSLIRQESAFGLKATSTSNALGLMQLIPPTALEVAQELNMTSIQIPDDLYEAEVNITMGTHYISKMIQQFGGNVPLGLAAYNAGPHRIKLFVQSRPEILQQTQNFSSDPFDEIWFDEVPWSETSFYVKAILRNLMIYQVLDKGRVSLDGLIWENKKRSSL